MRDGSNDDSDLLYHNLQSTSSRIISTGSAMRIDAFYGGVIKSNASLDESSVKTKRHAFDKTQEIFVEYTFIGEVLLCFFSLLIVFTLQSTVKGLHGMIQTSIDCPSTQFS